MVALLSLCPEDICGTRVVHFIDNTAALACVVRGFSRQPDLASIADRLWFEMAVIKCEYRAEFVQSAENLADGPSRDDLSGMLALGAVEVLGWKWPSYHGKFEGWTRTTSEACRAYS